MINRYQHSIFAPNIGNLHLKNTTIPSRIFLVGPMGAGKTTIGLKLAEALHKEFKDSDQEIEQNTGATIPLIFELEGEEGFRERETRMIARLANQENIILATGGGAVIKTENRTILSEKGYVIYLHASLDKLMERTSKDRNRPLLQTENPRQVLADLLYQREPLYREVADLVYETDKKPIREIINDIVDTLQNNSDSAN